MDLVKALAAIKPLLGETLALYSGMVAYADGILRAYDGVNSIKVEVPGHPSPWCVDGTKLTAIAKTGCELALDATHLVIKMGRSRFKLYNHAQNELVPDLSHEGDAIPISDDDWKTLKLATTFCSPHAVYPWAACIYVRDRKAYVTNNIVAAVFDIGLDVEGMIPAIAVQSLATAQDVHISPHCVTLTRDGLSLRCSLPVAEPPPQFFRVCNEIVEAVTPINEGLASAFESTTMIDSQNVIVRPNGIEASSGKGDLVEVDIETGSTVEGIFDPRYIVPALKVSEFVDWNLYPQPVVFKGVKVKGMIIGKSRINNLE